MLLGNKRNSEGRPIGTSADPPQSSRGSAAPMISRMHRTVWRRPFRKIAGVDALRALGLKLGRRVMYPWVSSWSLFARDTYPGIITEHGKTFLGESPSP